MSTSLYCNSVIVKSQNSGVSEWLHTNSAFLSNFPPFPTLAQSWSGTSMHCCQRPLWCFRFLSALSSWLAEEWIKGESELITSSIAKTQGPDSTKICFFSLWSVVILRVTLKICILTVWNLLEIPHPCQIVWGRGAQAFWTTFKWAVRWLHDSGPTFFSGRIKIAHLNCPNTLERDHLTRQNLNEISILVASIFCFASS